MKLAALVLLGLCAVGALAKKQGKARRRQPEPLTALASRPSIAVAAGEAGGGRSPASTHTNVTPAPRRGPGAATRRLPGQPSGTGRRWRGERPPPRQGLAAPALPPTAGFHYGAGWGPRSPTQLPLAAPLLQASARPTWLPLATAS